MNDMGFKIIEKVYSLNAALEICQKEGVKFDRTYQIHMPDCKQALYGIHTYINYGDDFNVAWWTPSLYTLAVYTAGGRKDGTPIHRRVTTLCQLYVI